MFNNPLFNSTGSGHGMPQYVQQPSTEGPQPDVIRMRKGKPVYGPLKAFNPTMAPPAWAQQAQPAAPQFGGLFASAPNPYIAPQNVAQPAGAAAPAKGVK
jgi:hypothetical protein